MLELSNFLRLGFGGRLYRKRYVLFVNLAAKVCSILLQWLLFFLVHKLAILKFHSIGEAGIYVF